VLTASATRVRVVAADERSADDRQVGEAHPGELRAVEADALLTVEVARPVEAVCAEHADDEMVDDRSLSRNGVEACDVRTVIDWPTQKKASGVVRPPRRRRWRVGLRHCDRGVDARQPSEWSDWPLVSRIADGRAEIEPAHERRQLVVGERRVFVVVGAASRSMPRRHVPRDDGMAHLGAPTVQVVPAAERERTDAARRVTAEAFGRGRTSPVAPPEKGT
jgi:hypothetical protein